MNKVIRILIMMISFSIVLNAEMRLSERYGEYYDKSGRKLVIDHYGNGVFEDKHGKSQVFKIGKSYSQETDYSFKMYRLGTIQEVSLTFTDKDSCIFILSWHVKYTFKKDPSFKGSRYLKYDLSPLKQ